MDVVWMLVKGEANFWYSPPAKNMADCWSNAEHWEQLCTGGGPIVGWRDQMKRDGWRPARVVIKRERNG